MLLEIRGTEGKIYYPSTREWVGKGKNIDRDVNGIQKFKGWTRYIWISVNECQKHNVDKKVILFI